MGAARRQDRRLGSVAFHDGIEQILFLQLTQSHKPEVVDPSSDSIDPSRRASIPDVREEAGRCGGSVQWPYFLEAAHVTGGEFASVE
jgi:hypothetical protein